MLAGADPEIRYYGGVRFDAGRETDENWRPFGSFRFVLPRFEYVVEGNTAELACNVVMPRDRDRLEVLARACRGIAVPRRFNPRAISKLVERSDNPEREEWHGQIRTALDLISHHAMQKIVLARRSSMRFEEAVSALSLLARLRKTAPARFHFLFEAGETSTFMGATPELLFARNGSSIQSEAVAGTRPCSGNEADDEVLLSALMDSEKDQREHLSVRWAIEEILRPFCSALAVDAEASEMRLAKGRHLVSRFIGTLRSGVSSWALLRHLHPTPAVGGYPAKAAIEAIREAEHFDRGWYAGPVGWVGRDSAEFAVALRCGLVRRDHLHLYSGAGIVTGSVPELEWDEIEHKIVDFANVLGLMPAD
jgi:menaquinone-specific isochorismate synthase